MRKPACFSGFWALAVLAAASLCSVPVFAAPVGVQWDWTGPSPITGFRLYCGSASGAHGTAAVATVNAAARSATLNLAQTGYAPVSHYCVARAYTTSPADESADSNELKIDLAAVPIPPPTNFRPLALTVIIDGEGRIVGARVTPLDEYAAVHWRDAGAAELARVMELGQ